jgi:hypothetical protein
MDVAVMCASDHLVSRHEECARRIAIAVDSTQVLGHRCVFELWLLVLFIVIVVVVIISDVVFFFLFVIVFLLVVALPCRMLVAITPRPRSTSLHLIFEPSNIR